MPRHISGQGTCSPREHLGPPAAMNMHLRWFNARTAITRTYVVAMTREHRHTQSQPRRSRLGHFLDNTWNGHRMRACISGSGTPIHQQSFRAIFSGFFD